MVTYAAADINMRKGGRRGSEREETEEGRRETEGGWVSAIDRVGTTSSHHLYCTLSHSGRCQGTIVTSPRER